MLMRFINHARGQVRIRVECAFPERVLNLCGARDLAFWDLQWESPTAFSCRLSRKDWKILRENAGPLDCSLSILRLEGAPYFLLRFRHRQILALGLVACALGLFLGSFFIWDFSVEGNVTVPDEKILRALEKNGVGLGTFGMSLENEDLRNHVLLDLPELSWITVSVYGCRADVQVRERIPAPVLLDKREPSNLTARRAGLVLNVQTIGGVAEVMKGSAVTKGQLLISGVEDTGTYGARVLAGMGKVEARTWYHLTASMPLTVSEKQYFKEKNAYSVIFGKHRIKFFSNSSIEGAEYDKITSRCPLSFFGVPLPVTFVRENWRFFQRVPVQRPAEQAEKTGERLLTKQLHSMVDPYGTVSSVLCSSRQKGDLLLVTLSAECQEEIGVSTPIYTEESSGDHTEQKQG